VSISTSRRLFVAATGRSLAAAIVASACPGYAIADELPHLAPDDPAAKALNYTEDASTVEAGRFPGRQPQQACVNCNYYAGKPDGFGPCPLFPGKAVTAKGWCSGWTKEV
jgi:high potential iron-sulfur protein